MPPARLTIRANRGAAWTDWLFTQEALVAEWKRAANTEAVGYVSRPDGLLILPSAQTQRGGDTASISPPLCVRLILLSYFSGSFLLTCLSGKKFSSETIERPSCSSRAFLVLPATLPPDDAAFAFSVSPCASVVWAIAAVDFSPSIVRTSSKSVVTGLLQTPFIAPEALAAQLGPPGTSDRRAA